MSYKLYADPITIVMFHSFPLDINNFKYFILYQQLKGDYEMQSIN